MDGIARTLRIAHSENDFDLRSRRRSDCEDDSNGQEIRRYTQLLSLTRTRTSLALKLLGTLPEPEIRHIAKSTGVSQALKQAALLTVISRG